MAKRFCIDYQLLLLFSHSVVSDSLWPQGLQHTRFPRPLLSPGVCSNSCSLSWWCHPTISSSVIPSPPALNLYQHQSFPVSWLSASCGQSIGALASVLPMSIQDWFSLGLLVWSLCSPGDSEESSPAPQFESISSLVLSFLYDPTHILTWVLEKLLFWLYGPLLTKWCLCFSFFYFKKNLFLTDWWLAYIIGLISVIHQHEITIGVSVVESPSHLMPIPTPLGYYRLLFEFPESCSKFPLAVYLHTLVYVFAF